MTPDLIEPEAVARARACFLTDDNLYGCAETTLIVLQESYGLPDAADFSPAMALNGGVAYSGSICGALSGAAMAVGRLAGQRIADHRQAKRTARDLVARLLAEFQAEFGAGDCRTLTGRDLSLPAEHEAFIQSGIWRERCMAQIEFVVRQLVRLHDEQVWDQTVRDLAAND
ncbi:MAG: C-GCAxxG-C-C family protein [Chloroflexota bacterium]